MTEARILVVDDTAVNIRVFEAALVPRGYTLVGAGSGQEALDVISREPVDLVLLDINMPGMNGYEVCRRIRETPAVAMVPIVMVTASSDEERVRALEAGADDFLRRPFDQTELLARVASLLRIKRYHDTLEGQAAELSAWNQTLEEQVAGAVMELERLRSLRRFLSPQLADAVLASNDAVLEPHRGQVAVLSCALQGFPSFVATCEPEEVLETLGTFHRVLGGVVEDSGATVGSAATDEVTLFFNDPLPVDQPVARAVAAAMTLRERMAAQVESWQRRGYALTVGAGLAYGYATLGRIGFEGRYDYTAVGPVVALAGRLRDAAAPGAVLVPAAVREELGGTVECERLDDVSLPGFPGVTDVWSIVGRRTGDAPAVVMAPPVPTPTSPSTAARAADVADVELRVLGPIEVWVDGQPVAITAAKERALLALLVVHRGVVLSVDWLADELWSGDPPESALAALRVYVSRLRKTLSAGGVADLLVTRATGYAVDAPPEAVDAARFDTLASAGHRQLADGDVKAARASLDEALALWRGTALPELVDAPVSRNEAVRLEEARLTAVEDRLEARLLCGEHREVVAELEALTRSHPMRQRMWGQRMVALHWSGRQPEAIRAYQELRDGLVEIGLEPGTELIELERAIVASSPELPWPPS